MIFRTVTLAAALAFSSLHLLDPQVKDDLFAGADKFSRNATNSTEVNLDGKMLGLASGVGGGDHKDLIKRLDFVIVRSYEYDKPNQYRMGDVEEFSKRLEGNGWSHVVKTRSATESTDVCLKSDNENQISELVVIAAEPKELTFVHLKGRMSLNDLMKAGQSYGVPQPPQDSKDSKDQADPKLKKH